MKHLQKTILILTCFLSLNLNVLATLTTHEWQNNHRGYSIELIPGTGVAGIAAEYVAAGTVYDANHPYPGWHFMHLDDLGNVISERTSWAQFDHEFRVVDIACQSANEFWITIQARHRGLPTDYVYVAGVDLSGNDLPVNPAIGIITNHQTHRNIYPTHSYFADNGYLYICGYSAANTEYPNEPNNNYSDKYGMMLRLDVSNGSVISYFWNSGFHYGKDNDMALKISPYNYGQTFPLLVTGASNETDHGSVQCYSNVSCALAAKFDANLSNVSMNGIYPYWEAVCYGDEERGRGLYGIDIRGGVYGGQNGYRAEDDADIVILINGFDGISPNSSTYGIVRIKNDLSVYNYPIPSIKMTGGFGKQFLELHGNSYTSMANNHIAVIGEQRTIYNPPCVSLPPGSLWPSSTNINPFINYMYFGYGWFDYTTGFLPLAPLPDHKIYLSSQGTSALTMDYLTGSIGVGETREDIRRLYTFASVERHYDNPNGGSNPPVSLPGMVLPIADNIENPSSTNLKTKFLQVNNIQYNEPDCQKHINDMCGSYFYDIAFDQSTFESVGYETINFDVYSIVTFTDVFNNFPSYTHCSTGYYKPGKSLGVKNVIDGNAISIYPNPATNELNIDLTNVDGKYEFVLTDVTGKVVVENSGVGGNAVKVSLPVLSTGVYIATVRANEIVHTEKVVIK